MAIDRDKIRMYIVDGAPIIGEINSESNDVIELNYPFRIVPDGKGNIQIAAIFLKEEWIKIYPGSCTLMALSVPENMKDVYIKYQQEAWSTIILPNQSGIIT